MSTALSRPVQDLLHVPAGRPRARRSSRAGHRSSRRTLDGVPDRPATVDVVFEERYWYPDDGGVVWIAGYQLVEPETGRYLARDAPELAALRLRVAGVAGAGRHYAAAVAA